MYADKDNIFTRYKYRITINKFRTTKYYVCSIPLLPYRFISKVIK